MSAAVCEIDEEHEAGIPDREGLPPARDRSRRRRSGDPARVFLYSHDTYGLGHLRRNLAIAEHLLTRNGAFSVRLLTGSPVIGSWSLPDRLDVTALPPVVKTGVETYTPRNSVMPFGLIKAYREARILKAVIQEAPDIFLVDHAPAGMNGELLSTLAFIRREMPHTQVILGLRDILDSPGTVRRIWSEQCILPLLDNLYDHILVYGCRDVFDVVEGYGIPGPIAEKLAYCGYIARPPRPACPIIHDRPHVLVTAGGGEDGFFLMEAYLKALAALPRGALGSRIVTGPLMSPVQQQALEALAAGLPEVEIIASTTDLPAMLAESDLVIAMGGYNTSVEIIASGKPAIIVPRAAPRAEQRMRAAMLTQLGLVWAIEPGADLVEKLSHYLSASLAGVRPQPKPHGLDLNGAARVGALFETLVGTAAQSLEAAQ